MNGAWPLERLRDCVTALLKHSGFTPEGTFDLASPQMFQLESWMDHAAQSFGCEVEPICAAYQDLESELSGICPAILLIGDRFIAIAGERKGKLRLVSPDDDIIEISTHALACELRRTRLGDRAHRTEELLDRCAIEGKRRERAAALLGDAQLGATPFRDGWRFRASCAAPLARWFAQIGAFRNAGLLVLSHIVEYALWLCSWAVLGSLSLSGHMDRGSLAGWALLLATIVPFRAMGLWLQGALAVSVGGLLKRRLLAGVLRLDPDEIRHQGIGSFLGQSFEADAIESLALGAGISGVLALVDLTLAGFVLGRFAILLVICLGLTLFFAWRFLVAYEQWTGNRLELTRDLVEAMTGHRTRLAQHSRERWHEDEDAGLDAYYTHSKRIDHIGTVLVKVVPRAWLVLGLICLAQTVVTGRSSQTEIAVILGGILLAWTSFDRIAGALSEISGAYVAWKRLKHLFNAARRAELAGTSGSPSTEPAHSARYVLEADRLTFRYRTNGPPVLDGCTLAIRRADRVLLEGPSGGGKTTLASLLAGARKPHSGLVLAGGLDMQTLGRDGWRKHVVWVPQFHENYILTGTLAFNLLCGRRWPALAADFDQAEEVCRGVGLGGLLERMPSGLLQMVGEGGWQLSHGERSRVFIARALLQNPGLLILDESFGALDPESLNTALTFTLERANALMVIAHP
ncbi:MAG: ABC transporter ATP-binding protein [Acidobacteriaceae bacterium]|nr:ABC transporter ATP-binding protein [Acidobacteriaceae bacterium]